MALSETAPFPLPLTSYERFMWRNDRPGYPSVFSVWLAVEGVVDERRLEAAFGAAVARHPLLSAVVAGSGRRARWRALDAPPPVAIDWRDDTTGPVPEPDLTRERGLAIVGARRAGGVDLVLHLHHACCDGGAAIELLGDVFGAYVSAPERPLDAGALARRGDDGARRGRRIRRGVSLGARFARALSFRPAVLAAAPDAAPDGYDPRALSGLPELRLGADATRALRTRAREEGGTLNDLLLAECLLAAGTWNADHGGGDRIRLLMPTNRRTEAHAGLPAANVLGFEPIDRRVRPATDAEDLRASVRAETRAIKERRRSSWLDDWMAVMNGTPPLLDAMLALPSSLYTGIVSNLGAPERAWPHLELRDGLVALDAAVLRRVGFAPPVRPRSPLSLGITTYAGELSVTGKACPRTLGHDGLERFLAHLGRRLEAG